MEDVAIAIDFAPGLDFKPNQDDCVKNLLKKVTDGCDTDTPFSSASSPMRQTASAREIGC